VGEREREMVGGLCYFGVLFSLLFLWPPPRASSSCVLLSFFFSGKCIGD